MKQSIISLVAAALAGQTGVTLAPRKPTGSPRRRKGYKKTPAERVCRIG